MFRIKVLSTEPRFLLGTQERQGHSDTMRLMSSESSWVLRFEAMILMMGTNPV